MYFGSDETLAGETAGQRITRGRRAAPALRDPGRGVGGARGAMRRCEERQRRAPRTSRSTVPTTRQSSRPCRPSCPRTTRSTTSSPSVRRSPSTRCRRSEAAGSDAKLVTFDLNPTPPRRSRTATIEFSIDQQPYVQGYLAVHVAVPEPEERQRHRRRRPGPDRSLLRRPDQHRRHPPVRGEQHPLADRRERPARPAGGRPRIQPEPRRFS